MQVKKHYLAVHIHVSMLSKVELSILGRFYNSFIDKGSLFHRNIIDTRNVSAIVDSDVMM